MINVTDTHVALELTRAEALVLFEWLARHGDVVPAEDTSEREVLWRIEGALERVLVEPLRPDYEAALAEAIRAVRDSRRPADDEPSKTSDPR